MFTPFTQWVIIIMSNSLELYLSRIAIIKRRYDFSKLNLIKVVLWLYDMMLDEKNYNRNTISNTRITTVLAHYVRTVTSLRVAYDSARMGFL